MNTQSKLVLVPVQPLFAAGEEDALPVGFASLDDIVGCLVEAVL